MTTLRIGSPPLVKTTGQRRAERRARLARIGDAAEWLGWKLFYGLFAVLACWLSSGNAVT